MRSGVSGRKERPNSSRRPGAGLPRLPQPLRLCLLRGPHIIRISPLALHTGPIFLLYSSHTIFALCPYCRAARELVRVLFSYCSVIRAISVPY